jgi:hypothetical protein
VGALTDDSFPAADGQDYVALCMCGFEDSQQRCSTCFSTLVHVYTFKSHDAGSPAVFWALTHVSRPTLPGHLSRQEAEMNMASLTSTGNTRGPI